MTCIPSGSAACGHEAPPVAPAVCAHLRATREPWLSYYRCFSGAEFDHQLLCSECADQFDAGASPTTFHLCAECLDFATTEVGDLVGVRGQPEVLDEPDGHDRPLLTISLPPLPSALIDVAFAEAAGVWCGLCEDGTIVRFSRNWDSADRIARAPFFDEPDHAFTGHHLRRHLHLSNRAGTAAVVNDYGKHGAVIDLTSGDVTMRLDGGDYHPETVPFSLAFATADGREVLVHRTAWNRLDASDPQSGQLLTDRGPTSYQRDEPRPDHYLDYFHGRLYVSPDGQRLLDDGWVWHPIGIPEVWDLQRWLSDNVWESEDGASKVSLDGRDYYWDHGMCWIDSRRVAIEGIGSDDDHMVHGVWIFDVTERHPSSKITWPTALELASFAGPRGQFFSDGTQLFTASDDGLSLWDIETGARVGLIRGFTPSRHALGFRELVEIRGDHLVTWRYD